MVMGITVRDGVCSIDGVLMRSYMEYNISNATEIDVQT